MSIVEQFHNTFYSEHILDLDEQGNNFDKVSSLWLDAKPRQRVLDIGCGAGAVSGELVRRGHEVHGVDLQEKAIQRACSRGVRARVADLNEPLPFEDKSFDAVLACDIVEHVYDPLALLKEVRRVVSDDGYAILIIPHHFDLVQRVRMLFGGGIVTAEHLHYSKAYKPWNYVHIRFFTIGEASDLIREAGFEVEKREFTGMPIFFFAQPWRLLLRFLSNRLTRPLMPTLLAGGVRVRVRKKLDVGARDNRG